jgi:hypothetical protein
LLPVAGLAWPGPMFVNSFRFLLRVNHSWHDEH